MRAICAVFLACLFLEAASPQAKAQAASPTALITFTYENDKLTPSYYRLSIREDGTGTYNSQGGIEVGEVRGSGKPFEREITISAPLLKTIFSTAREHKFFAVGCEAQGIGRVAFQGKKTLTYQGPDGKGSCTFNYSTMKQIQQLSGSLQSVGLTIEVGRRLSVEQQYGRLTLDAELGALEESASTGRAIELQNIRPLLEEIAADPNVLNRARQRAALLAAGGKH